MKITKEQVLKLVNGLNKSFNYKYTALKEPDTSSYAIIVDTRTKCNSYVARIYDDGSLHQGNFYDYGARNYINSWLKTIKTESENILDHEHGLAATPHFGCECVPKEWLSSNDDNSSELDKMLIDTAKSLSNKIRRGSPEIQNTAEMSNSLLDIVKYLDGKGLNKSTSKSIKEAIDEAFKEFNKKLF